MKELRDYTTDELVAELAQRKINEQVRPKLNRDINWMPVIEYIVVGVH